MSDTEEIQTQEEEREEVTQEVVQEVVQEAAAAENSVSESGDAEVDEFKKCMLEGAKALREALAEEEDTIARLRAKQEIRMKRRDSEMMRLEEMRKAEEQRRREEEAEKKRIKDEEKERRRLEKEKTEREKAERASKKGMKNFKVTKSDKSSLDAYNKEKEKPVTMTGGKTKEELDQEKRATLQQRIVPLDITGLDTSALIAKAKELHDKLYKLESDKYDLDDRFKRQQYDMMELAERARQMNKGGAAPSKSSSVKIEDEPAGPCPQRAPTVNADGGFDAISEKYSNAPPKVAVCSKYDRQTDKRSYKERMAVFLHDKNKSKNSKPPAKSKKQKEETEEPSAEE